MVSGGSTGGGSTTPTTLTIDIEAGSLASADGSESNDANRWRTVDYLKVSDLTNTISINSKFIIACYDSSQAYLGQLSTDGTSLIKGTGQWYSASAVVNVSSITTANSSVTYVRFIMQSSSVQILINGIDCFGELIGDSADEITVAYPFELGTLLKETGVEQAGTSRVRTDYLALTDLGTVFGVQECTFAVCCYDADQAYLGQYDNTTKAITSGDTITAAIWNAKDTTTTVADLTALSVGYVRILGSTPTAVPHLYVDGVAMAA